jgi:5-(carboxyamino)imidazole ribonucleotide mutase
MRRKPQVADPKVAIVYGSPSDANVMSKAGAMLDRFGVSYEEVSLSAHRAPLVLNAWLAGLEDRGVEVIIAGAGLSAALPGVCASHSALPVIGVPIRGGALNGLDALLAIAQMPPGVPVACVGLDNSTNAAVLAVQIIAGHEPALRVKLAEFKESFEQAAAAELAG